MPTTPKKTDPKPNVPQDPVQDTDPSPFKTPAGAPANENPKKGESRLFQVHPDKKVWLTKAEAEKQGFYWNDNVKT